MAQQLGLDSLAEALAAGVGGVVCTTVLYPLEIVKNKLQVATRADRKAGDPVRSPGSKQPSTGINWD
eukprot:SAG31_NODE_1249_length_9118_cov_23.165318_5_plen_67_part_00